MQVHCKTSEALNLVAYVNRGRPVVVSLSSDRAEECAI